MEQAWESIEAIVSRRELREAVDAVGDMVPPPGADPDGDVRARLAERINTVSGFLKILTDVIEFGATPEAEGVLAAMKTLPRFLNNRYKVTRADIDESLLTGSWKQLVLGAGGRQLDKNAYVFCVFTQFHTTSNAATSTRPPRPAGATRAPSCWPGTRGRRPRARR